MVKPSTWVVTRAVSPEVVSAPASVLVRALTWVELRAPSWVVFSTATSLVVSMLS